VTACSKVSSVWGTTTGCSSRSSRALPVHEDDDDSAFESALMAREGGRPERDGDRDVEGGEPPPPPVERTAETVVAVEAREGDNGSEYGAEGDPRELAGILRD
jgi:hypothetical protein